MESRDKRDLIFDELMLEKSKEVDYLIHDGSIGEYAKHYETWRRAQNILRYFREEIIRKEGPLRIVDIGCEYGAYIWYLGNFLAGRPAEFRGIDISGSRIALARHIQERLKIDNVSFSAADATATGLPDEWADLVLSAEVIEHIKEPKDCLKEIRRILKPGGAAIITTPNGRNGIRAVSWLFNWLHKIPETEEAVPVKDTRAIYDRHVSIKDLRGWIEIFKNSGFTVERVRRGSLFQGGSKYDSFPLLFSASLVLDAVLDLVPFARTVTENFAFKLRRPS